MAAIVTASHFGENETAGETTPATTVLMIPETNPINEAAMPRRVGNRSSTRNDMVGIAIALPSA